MSVGAEDISDIKWDVVVIGAGTAGGDCAIRAAQLGLKTIVVEKNALGGTCVNVGCIPTKMLIKIADHYRDSFESSNFGIEYGDISLNLDKVMSIKKMIIDQVIQWYLYTVFPSYDITVALDTATIISPNKVKIGRTIVETKNIVIATGSRPKIPSIKGVKEGLENKYVVTSDDALNFTEAPDKILTIGGGAIGIELSTLWHKFGSKVTIVELMDRLLPTMDPELGGGIKKLLLEKGFKIYTSTSVTKIDSLNKKVYLSNGLVLNPDKILLSIGRAPIIDTVGADNIGVKMNKNGIEVDSRMRTSIPNIYAAGDATGRYMLASTAKAQGIVAAENIAGLDSEVDYSILPIGIFSDPEIGSVGVSASKNNPNFIVAKFPNAVNFRAIAYWKPYGFTKIVLDPSDKRIVGFHMIGMFATEIVNSAAIAIKKRMRLEEAKDMIFTHPVMSEVFVDTFHLADGSNVYLPKRK